MVIQVVDDFVKVEGGIWLEIADLGDFILVIGKWAILLHIHIGTFDKFFGVDFRERKFVIDPIIWYEEPREVIIR